VSRSSARAFSARPVSARASSAVDTSLLALCVAASLILVFLPGELRDRAASTLRRTAVAPLAELQRWAEERRAQIQGYEGRVRAHADTASAVAAATALRAENEQLRRMLGLGSRLQWGFITAEAIPNELPSELVAKQVVLTFMLTRGARAGVTAFTPVIAPQGLVGMVQTVDPAMSIAITYSHPDFRVSAMTSDQAAFGIVQPHLGSGAERGLLEMRGVPFRTPLKPGQTVVSSGLGATYPRGVPVGSVLREIQTPEKWARTYLLEPAVALADVGPVLLLLRNRAEAGVDSVWTSVRASDSASRAVATAGDSLARAAAESRRSESATSASKTARRPA
jgi:rod shape-determining protein MreC